MGDFKPDILFSVKHFKVLSDQVEYMHRYGIESLLLQTGKQYLILSHFQQFWMFSSLFQLYTTGHPNCNTKKDIVHLKSCILDGQQFIFQ